MQNMITYLAAKSIFFTFFSREMSRHVDEP